MSSGQNAPTPYQPANQPGADASYQQGASQLANAGSALYGQVAPQLSQISSAVQNNPYQAQALAGAQQAAGTAINTVAPQQLAGAAADSSLAGMSAAAGQQANSQAQSYLPSATAGLQYAPGMIPQTQAQIPGTTQPLINAGNQVLQTGFDPQGALYTQQFQQQQDQQNAAAAMNGVAGSPYAAGLSNDANMRFNTNWQNNQLQRQLQALSGAGTAFGQADTNLEGLQSTGVNDFNALTSGAVNNASNLISTGFNAQNAGAQTAIAGNSAASQLGTDALNTEAGAAQLPSDVYLQQQQADLAAIGAQISGTNASTATTQQAVADQGNYLNIGQTATAGADQAAQINNQQANAQAAGFGQLFGDITGMFSFGGSSGGGIAALAAA
jgi:hypothetical protein